MPQENFSQSQRVEQRSEFVQQSSALQNPEKPRVIEDEALNENFPGSIIVKKSDGTYFAVRQNTEGEWEGNSFKLMSEGVIGAVYREREIDPEILEAIKTKKELTVPLLDRSLMQLARDHEKRAHFIDDLKQLSPERMVDLYHGLNGNLLNALSVIDSPDQGLRQISGPALSAYPIGQFWKPGDAGIKYSIPRNDIEFPGEANPDAHFRMDNEGTVLLVNGLEALPLTEFKGEILRTELKQPVYEERLTDGTWTDVEIGEKTVPLSAEEKETEIKIQKKLKDLNNIRNIKDQIKAV